MLVVPHDNRSKPPALDAVSVSAEPSPRPRSGYARLRNRHRELIRLYERLELDHTKLTREHEALKAGHAELQSAFDEILGIHHALLEDLKQARQARANTQSSPLPGIGLSLMGRRYG
jgi:hypothetical protein